MMNANTSPECINQRLTNLSPSEMPNNFLQIIWVDNFPIRERELRRGSTRVKSFKAMNGKITLLTGSILLRHLIILWKLLFRFLGALGSLLFFFRLHKLFPRFKVRYLFLPTGVCFAPLLLGFDQLIEGFISYLFAAGAIIVEENCRKRICFMKLGDHWKCCDGNLVEFCLADFSLLHLFEHLCLDFAVIGMSSVDFTSELFDDFVEW